MNDSQVLELLASADAYAPTTSLPEDIWSVDTISREVERRVYMTKTQERPTQAVPPTPSRQGLLVAAAAFVVVLLIGVTIWALGFGDEPEVVDPPPTTQATTTTLDAATTTVAPTTTAPTTTEAASTTTAAPQPAAVPFEGRIAMELDHQGLGGAGAIYVADSAVAELVFWDTMVSQEPDWSPDGTSIVFSKTNGPDPAPGADIWIVDVRTGAARALYTDPSNMRRPRFSPDGQLIAFVFVADNFSDPVDVGIVDLEGELVTRIPVAANVVAWSPDGTELAYGLDDDSGGGLWVTDLGGNSRQILATHDIATSLRWGTDGILTTVREVDTLGNHSVALIDPESGTIVETLDSQWIDPTWGPGGDILVVDRSSGELYGRDASGEFYGPLVTGPHRFEGPVWAPPPG